MRTVYSIEVHEQDDIVYLDVCGNGFLYNMVRIIAGTLIDVGRHRLTAQTIEEMLEKRDRTLGGPTAPPEGLTLLEVYYDATLRYEQT